MSNNSKKGRVLSNYSNDEAATIRSSIAIKLLNVSRQRRRNSRKILLKIAEEYENQTPLSSNVSFRRDCINKNKSSSNTSWLLSAVAKQLERDPFHVTSISKTTPEEDDEDDNDDSHDDDSNDVSPTSTTSNSLRLDDI